MSDINDQRKLLQFLNRIRTCDNSIVRSFSILSTYEYGKMTRYSVHNLCSGIVELKSSLWRHLVVTVVLLSICVHLVLVDQYDLEYECFYVYCLTSVRRVVTSFFYVYAARRNKRQ